MKYVPKVILSKINSFVHEIRDMKGVCGIILFGSYARGDFKPLSDIDLCVIVSYDCSKHVKDLILASSNEKVDVSLFFDLPLSVRYSIICEGKVLFGSPDFIQALLYRTTLEYLDFQHLLERQRQRVFV